MRFFTVSTKYWYLEKKRFKQTLFNPGLFKIKKEAVTSLQGLLAVILSVHTRLKEYLSYILTGVGQVVVEVTGDRASLTCLLIHASLFTNQPPRQQSQQTALTLLDQYHLQLPGLASVTMVQLVFLVHMQHITR